LDREKAIKAVKMLLEAIGENPEREGLKETPRRVADAFAEFTKGDDEEAKKALAKTFSVEAGGLVIEKDIAFSSTCEHHLMPFFGKIAIAYVPNGKVVGLSKLARCVEEYARRLQLQERLTAQIAEAVYTSLSAKGVMVLCEAEHTCMTCRGVNKAGTKTITYKTLGDFSDSLISQVLSAVK